MKFDQKGKGWLAQLAKIEIKHYNKPETAVRDIIPIHQVLGGNHPTELSQNT